MALSYDFQFLSDKLLSLGAICSAAELQGMYCGLLAGGQSWDEDKWFGHAREFADLTHFDPSEEQKAVLLFVYESSREGLMSDDFSFQPLLPADECPVEDRARELGAWCRGFLHGFGASGVTKDTKLSAEVAEVLRDMAQICSAVRTVEEEENETDADLLELIEYLRAGVLTVYSEMNGASDSSAADGAKSIH